MQLLVWGHASLVDRVFVYNIYIVFDHPADHWVTARNLGTEPSFQSGLSDSQLVLNCLYGSFGPAIRS